MEIDYQNSDPKIAALIAYIPHSEDSVYLLRVDSQAAKL